MNITTIANPANTTLALSDGTAVEFVKITSKDNIQVRVPSTHPTLGSDPLRIFRRDGSHYKNATDLKLIEAPLTPKADPVPAKAAPSDATFFVGDNTIGFATLDEAITEASTVFASTGAVVSIEKVERTLVGRFGFVAA